MLHYRDCLNMAVSGAIVGVAAVPVGWTGDAQLAAGTGLSRPEHQKAIQEK